MAVAAEPALPDDARGASATHGAVLVTGLEQFALPGDH